MDFKPIIRRDPLLMDAAIFATEPMNLRQRMLAVPLSQRLAYDSEHNILFLNFERLSVRSQADVDAIYNEVVKRLEPLGHRVYAIVNYDHFDSQRTSKTSTWRWSRRWSIATTSA